MRVGRYVREPIDRVAGDEPLDRSARVGDARELSMAGLICESLGVEVDSVAVGRPFRSVEMSFPGVDDDRWTMGLQQCQLSGLGKFANLDIGKA